jgi:hypothetical protein
VFHMSEPVPCQHSSIIGRSPEKLGPCRRDVRRRRLRVSDIYFSSLVSDHGVKHSNGFKDPR